MSCCRLFIFRWNGIYLHWLYRFVVKGESPLHAKDLAFYIFCDNFHEILMFNKKIAYLSVDCTYPIKFQTRTWL